jgi:hypothetical protein
LLVIIEVEFHFIPKPAWTTVFLFVLLRVVGMISAKNHTQPLVVMGSYELFAWGSLKL